MEDILQGGTEGAAPTEMGLSDLVETNPAGTSVPVGAVRNRAATTAILSSNSDNLVDRYRLIMQEGTEGSSVTHDQAMEAIEVQNKTKTMKHVINILGDKTVPLDQKKRLMNFVQTDGFKEEPAITLQTKSLEKPSEGEDLKGEAARISLADSMAGINKEAQERQRLVNGLNAEIASGSRERGNEGAQFVGDMAAADVLPFGRNIIGAKVAAKMDELDGKTTSMGAWVKNFLLPGSTKQDLQDRLMAIPPDRRGDVTQKLLQAVKESASVFHSDNYYAKYQTAARLLDEPSHSNTEVWLENMTTVLDAFWVGGEVKALAGAGRTVKAVEAGADYGRARRPGSADPGISDAENVRDVPGKPKAAPFTPQIAQDVPKLEYKQADVTKRLQLNSVVRRENPVAPFNVIEQANPADARALHEAILQGEDEFAHAITGVGKEQAVINNIAPQVGSESGNVLNKVDQTLLEQVQNTGATRYTPAEFQSAVDVIKSDFRNASGLQINDAMTTFRVDGDHIYVDGHYATPGGAFVTPEAAREQAKYSLRGYGIGDEDIVVMKRAGMEYVPTTAADTQAGDYIIKVKSKIPVDDGSIQSWNPLDVKRNFFDRISQTTTEDKGHLTGWLQDPGSMLHPTLTGSASIAADQSIVLENMLLTPIKEFRATVSSLPKARRQMVEDYIKEANTNGIAQDHFDLIARGFTQVERDALNKWKTIWDNHYYLENYDMVRTLNSQGYQIFENQANKLFGKPVPKNQNINSVFDPATNSVRSLTKAEMDSLYNQGGSYVALRRPVTIGGQEIEHMMVRNTPQEYMRKVRGTDQILNYREGYYTVSYKKGSKFVDEISSVGGKETRRTVAVAGNTSDAQMFANAQQASTGKRHVVREDTRGFAKDGDGYWDVNSAAGRIAQRLRGQPLQTASGINSLGTGVHIENPMESAARSARSISGRTVTRPMLETAKNRFMQQYSDFLPSNGMGGKRYPNHHSEIVDHFSHTSSKVADARTTYGYIKFLEDGYINTADQIFKGGMNVVADMLGAAGLSKMENAAQAVGRVAPSTLAKAVVFKAYIVGSNPIRQWIVQAHQATRMAAYNPIGMLSGQIHKRMVGYIGEYTGFNTGNQSIKDFIKFVDDSGMVAGVDRNSLVRGLGLSMADSSSKVKRIIGGIEAAPQTLGFDIGEKINQLGHLAAVHDKWTREGIDLTNKTNRDLALTEARALSYDLNKAGELTYTQSTPAMILQFLQMPHKAILQLTNRKVPTAVGIRLAAWDLIMFGIGGGLLSEGVRKLWTMSGEDGNDMLPDNPETRDMVVYGMESYALNKMFSNLDDSGDRSRIDFSALAPNDMDGWARMYHAMMEQGPYAALAASPAGQLLAVDGTNGSRRNGRIPQAVLTMGRFFNVFEELDPSNPTEFSAVLNDVAKISSGWTAADNAKMMYATRKKMDAKGVTVDGSVTIPEIWAAGLGFGTLSTKELYMVSQDLSDTKKTHEEKVMKKYRDIVTYYKDELGKEGGDLAHTQKVTSMLLRTFDQPGDLQLVVKQFQKDMVGKEQGLLKQMLTASGIPDSKKMEDDIKMSPLPEETKALLIQRTRGFREMTKQNKESKGN